MMNPPGRMDGFIVELVPHPLICHHMLHVRMAADANQ